MTSRRPSADAGHPAPRRPGSPAGHGPASEDGAVFTERIDGRLGAIRAHGHLTVRAADMVRGTVEALRRSGHDTVLLDLREVRRADDDGLRALRSLQENVRSTGGRLTLANAPAAQA